MLDGVNPADFDKTPAGKYVLPILIDDDRPAAMHTQALRLVARRMIGHSRRPLFEKLLAGRTDKTLTTGSRAARSARVSLAEARRRV